MSAGGAAPARQPRDLTADLGAAVAEARLRGGCLVAAARVLAADAESRPDDALARETVRLGQAIYDQFVSRALERRQDRRYAVDQPARVVAAGSPLPCRLVNLSVGGALIRLGASLAPGTGLLLELEDGLSVPASIVTTGDGTAHLRFRLEPGERRRLADFIHRNGTRPSPT